MSTTAKSGDIVSLYDFPLPTGGVDFKFALVINDPAQFGGDAILIELTTKPAPKQNLVKAEDLEDSSRRTSSKPYQYPNSTLSLKGSFAQVSLSRSPNPIIWACVNANSWESIHNRAWDILEQSR